jgi:hypothetical protein
MGCEIASVVISGGEKTTSGSGNKWNVPKCDLMAGVRVLLQRGELRIAPTLKEADTLVREPIIRMSSGTMRCCGRIAGWTSAGMSPDHEIGAL